MKTKLFKRILSTVLALVFVLALAAPLAVSADTVDLGVKTAVNQNNSATAWKASKTDLTQKGLLLHTFVNGGSAVMLTTTHYDLSAITEDVTVSLKMTSEHYNWSANQETATKTIAPSSKNYTWLVFGVGSDNSANLTASGAWNYCTEMTDENQSSIKVCYNETDKYHLYWNQQVIASNSKIAEAIVTGNDAVIYDFSFNASAKTMTKVTLTLASDVSKTLELDITDVAIGASNFAFGLREVYGDVYTHFDGYVSDIAVKTATATKYSVDFKQMYVDNGGVVGPDTPDAPLVIDPVAFDANRTIPKSNATLGFEDTPLTEYVDGAVLHHVDFKKVTDLASVGYYVTKPAEKMDSTTGLGTGTYYGESKYAYTSQGLYLEGADGIAYLVPTGVVMPEYNRDFTIEIEFRFVEENAQRYLCLCPNTTLDETTGTASHSGDVCIRWDQTNESSNGFDSAKRKEEYTAEQGAAINDARDNFEFVTYQFHFVNRKLDAATISSGDTTIEVTPKNALLATDFSFMIGNNKGGNNVKVIIDHITVISGEAEYAKESLTWSGDAGANVLVTPASAVKEVSSANKTDKPSKDKTEKKENEDTEDTKATETTEVIDASVESKGCGSSIGFAAVSVVALAAGTVAVTKKKRKD